MQKNSAEREKAFLVGTILRGTTLSQVEEQLEELKWIIITSENADEVGGQVAKSEIIGSDTVKYGKLDPKKYLNDISWSN